MKHFDLLGLSPLLVRALREEGYATPTPIQQEAIGPILERRDVLGCAQTGTGKTAAFALPILHNLKPAPAGKAAPGTRLPRVLVLAPTRELASQIGESFAAYGRHMPHRCAVIFGGVSQFHQVKELQRGVDILVATPGRLIDLMEQRLVKLTAVEVLVLDESDRMLDMGFIDSIRRIVAALPKGASRQTLLFSATMPPEIRKLAEALLHEPVPVAVTPVASAAPMIEQLVYTVPRAQKTALLQHLLADQAIERVLIFTRTKHGADRLTAQLHRAGIACDAIHGNKAQNQRRRALEGFRRGASRVLVATDIAARGIDVEAITHVFNYDMPMEPEAYVHRIGRTGRAGATGIAISFCSDEERQQLRMIERLLGEYLPLAKPPQGLPEGERPSRSRAHASPSRPRHAPHRSAAPVAAESAAPPEAPARTRERPPLRRKRGRAARPLRRR